MDHAARGSGSALALATRPAPSPAASGQLASVDLRGHGGSPASRDELAAAVARWLVERCAWPTARNVHHAIRALAADPSSSRAPAAVDPGVVERVIADLVGLGPLHELVLQPGVTDVLVCAPDQVWIDDGRGLRPSPVSFADEEAVRRLAGRLALAAGRRLDAAQPFVDLRLAGGIRLHAAIPPVVGRTTISLRVPRREGWTLPRLVAAGALTVEASAWLGAIVAARCTFVICGGTGTGKTSLLGALIDVMPADERIVLIEQTAELVPAHRHVVALRARPPNSEGSGGIGLDELVRQSLRMRPDRIVVGEVRGSEVADLFAALNSGHSGGGVTLHANAPSAVPSRLEALATAAGLDRIAAHAQMAASIDVVIELARRPRGGRQVRGLHSVVRGSDGSVRVVPAVRFDSAGAAVNRHGIRLGARVFGCIRPAVASGVAG